MKKDRDSFFSQYGYTGYNMPNMYSNNQNQLLGYQMPDINSRLNKIEETLFNLEKNKFEVSTSVLGFDYRETLANLEIALIEKNSKEIGGKTLREKERKSYEDISCERT